MRFKISLAILVTSCCLLSSCATWTNRGTFKGGIFKNYTNASLPGVYKSRAKTFGARAFLVDPVFTVWYTITNVVSLRLLWDHKDFPLSGLTNTLLGVFTIVPFYFHHDEWVHCVYKGCN